MILFLCKKGLLGGVLIYIIYHIKPLAGEVKVFPCVLVMLFFLPLDY